MFRLFLFVSDMFFLPSATIAFVYMGREKMTLRFRYNLRKDFPQSPTDFPLDVDFIINRTQF
jgi:hypothetical protein